MTGVTGWPAEPADGRYLPQCGLPLSPSVRCPAAATELLSIEAMFSMVPDPAFVAPAVLFACPAHVAAVLGLAPGEPAPPVESQATNSWTDIVLDDGPDGGVGDG